MYKTVTTSQVLGVAQANEVQQQTFVVRTDVIILVVFDRVVVAVVIVTLVSVLPLLLNLDRFLRSGGGRWRCIVVVT